MIKSKALGADQTWFAVTNPQKENLDALVDQYQIPRRFIRYMRDGKQRARFDYDFETKCSLFIFKVIDPTTGKKIEETTTTPFSLLLINNTLISVTRGKGEQVNRVIDDVCAGTSVLGKQKQTLMMIVMAVMFQLNEDYFDRINELDILRQKLEKYKTRPSNDQISQLAELSKSMIYLKAAASGNLIAMRQLQGIAESDDYAITLSKDERYWLKNLQEEFDQAREMAEVNGEIVEQVTSAYANVLDNSLNTTMWILTVWSLVLAVPPIISGFYGMNVKLPLFGGWLDWPFSVLLSLIPISVLLWYLRRRHALSNHNR